VYFKLSPRLADSVLSTDKLYVLSNDTIINSNNYERNNLAMIAFHCIGILKIFNIFDTENSMIMIQNATKIWSTILDIFKSQFGR